MLYFIRTEAIGYFASAEATKGLSDRPLETFGCNTNLGGETVKERIRQIRKDLGLTQSDFGVSIGVSRDAVATYESGRVVPDKSIRLLICQKFNVSEIWLETGEGKPYKEGLIPELVRALRHMPAAQAALERMLPRLTVQDFENLNTAIAHMLDDDDQQNESAW